MKYVSLIVRYIIIVYTLILEILKHRVNIYHVNKKNLIFHLIIDIKSAKLGEVF